MPPSKRAGDDVEGTAVQRKVNRKVNKLRRLTKFYQAARRREAAVLGGLVKLAIAAE